MITIASLGIPLDLFRDSPGWRPDIARREEARGARKPEQPIAAVEYEYRCAEYEYEYDGGGNPLRCLAVIRTQSASADGTRTRTRCSSDTPMMLSAKITIGGPRFPPGFTPVEATTDSYFAPRPFRLTPSVGASPQRTRVGGRIR